jgi:energy-coupling factor transport system ATP-binding protein
VAKGEYVAIVGHTGAGKSTLLQLMTGLIKADSGNVYVDGLDVADCGKDLRRLRCKTGYVFQYPEHQLFAENVYEDVVFGPRNLGVSEVEAEKRAYEAISMVGLSDEVYDMPPSKLSGGQKRRAALAGVLAMQPEYLILDEPVAGLDPDGRQEMLDIINRLHREKGVTIIMVSHDVESVAAYADRVIVMESGEISYNGKPEQSFYHMWQQGKCIEELPVIMQVLIKLRKAGLPVDCLTTDYNKGANSIIELLK